jgi:hypothetical protein
MTEPWRWWSTFQPYAHLNLSVLFLHRTPRPAPLLRTGMAIVAELGGVHVAAIAILWIGQFQTWPRSIPFGQVTRIFMTLATMLVASIFHAAGS